MVIKTLKRYLSDNVREKDHIKERKDGKEVELKLRRQTGELGEIFA